MGQHPPARRRWSRVRVAVAAAVALLLVAGVAALAIGNFGQPEPDAGTDVARVTRADQTTSVTLAGTLAPQRQANASFEVGGTVTAIQVRVGDPVDVGTPLATLDDRDLRNAVALAEANLTAARAQVQAVRDADGSSAAQLAAARAQAEAAQASVDNARQRLEDARLTSPLAGVVAEVSIEVGDQVGGGSVPSLATSGASNPLSGLGIGGLGSTSSSGSGIAHVVVVVPDAWKLEATIGTVDLPALKSGQPAVVTPTGTSTRVSAVVDTVGIVATGSSGAAATFPVTLTITEPGVQLFSGADADAVVTTDTVPDVLTIPAEAVTHAATGTSVRRPDSTTTDVTVGRRFGDRIEVLAGLAEGDEVLVPRGLVVTPPPRPQFGPGGRLASPDPTPTPSP